jgi:hypothetical protein
MRRTVTDPLVARLGRRAVVRPRERARRAPPCQLTISAVVEPAGARRRRRVRRHELPRRHPRRRQRPTSVGAQLVSSSGALLGALIRASTPVRLRWSLFGGGQYLVAWTDDALFPDNDVWGMFVSTAGVAGAPFPLSASAFDEQLDGLPSTARTSSSSSKPIRTVRRAAT